jgi:hypothetical protein
VSHSVSICTCGLQAGWWLRSRLWQAAQMDMYRQPTSLLVHVPARRSLVAAVAAAAAASQGVHSGTVGVCAELAQIKGSLRLISVPSPLAAGSPGCSIPTRRCFSVLPSNRFSQTGVAARACCGKAVYTGPRNNRPSPNDKPLSQSQADSWVAGLGPGQRLKGGVACVIAGLAHFGSPLTATHGQHAGWAVNRRYTIGMSSLGHSPREHLASQNQATMPSSEGRPAPTSSSGTPAASSAAAPVLLVDGHSLAHRAFHAMESRPAGYVSLAWLERSVEVLLAMQERQTWAPARHPSNVALGPMLCFRLH